MSLVDSIELTMSEALLFNPVKFIEEVKVRPGLYDPAHPMDRNERLELWKEVGAVLFPDWDTYSKATAYDRVLQLQKKWRSFRDAYNRELRTRRLDAAGTRRSRKVYRYFKRMSFLGGFEGEISVSESSDVEDEQRPLYTMQDIEQKNAKAEAGEEEYQPLQAISIKSSQKSSKKTKVKRRRSSSSIQATEEYEMPMPLFSSTDMTENDFDSDRLFLMSFAPEMRQLPVHLKMWARTQIANIMQEAVNSYCNNTIPQSSFNIEEIKRKRSLSIDSE